MMAVSCAALTSKRIAGRGDGDEPGADAERAARAEPRGAGAIERARHDDRVPARIFVALRPAARESRRATARARWRRSWARSRRARSPGCRYRRASPRRNGCRPGKRRWPGFRRKKVTVAAASMATPLTSPVRAVDAARHIDRDDGQRPTSLTRLDQAGELAFDRTREPGAEQRIDHHIGACEHVGIERLAAARRQRLAMAAASAGKPAHVAVEAEPAPCSRARARWRAATKAVAAIIAGTAKDGDACSTSGKRRATSFGDGAAGILHQRRARPRRPRWRACRRAPISSAVRSSIIDLCMRIISVHHASEQTKQRLTILLNSYAACLKLAQRCLAERRKLLQ